MFRTHQLPGQGFYPFAVWEKLGKLSITGRAGEGVYAPAAKTLLGMVTNASQREIEQWKQNSHPITHKIISNGAEVGVEPGNYLTLADGRQFYVQGKKNPGNLNAAILYYVEERCDLKIGEEP